MSGLLRYQIFLGYGMLFLALWYAALQQQESSQPFPQHPWIFDYAPVWAILLLGVYAITCVVLGVWNFKDFPEAAAEIEQQVKEARKEMQKRGVIVVEPKQ